MGFFLELPVNEVDNERQIELFPNHVRQGTLRMKMDDISKKEEKNHFLKHSFNRTVNDVTYCDCHVTLFFLPNLISHCT